MNMDDILRLDATGQAELIRRGELTPSELVETAIRRIERLNPKLNAVIYTLFEEGLAEARKAHEMMRRERRARHARPAMAGSDSPPFLGVPFLVKEFADIAGVPTTLGSRFVAEAYRSGAPLPEADSEVVSLFRRAGLIIIGKSNVPELGLLPTTEPLLYGPTPNPWDKTRTPGGSSGGAACAVTAGMVPIAHANDAGGSIRIPASCCGLFGFKPSGTPGELLVEHVITRSVRDSVAMYRFGKGNAGRNGWGAQIEGGAHSGRDPHKGRDTAKGTDAHTGRDAHTVNAPRLRIGYSTFAPTGAPLHPECKEAVLDAVRLCEALGHHVTEASPQYDGVATTEAFMRLWAAECLKSVSRLKSRLVDQWPTDVDSLDPRSIDPRSLDPDSLDPDSLHPASLDPHFTRSGSGTLCGFEPATLALVEQGLRLTPADLAAALEQLQKACAAIDRFFTQYDVWLTPTLASPPVPLGTFSYDKELFDRTNAFSPFTPIINVAGLPAMSVPLYWSDAEQAADAGNGNDGVSLPIGTHFVARRGHDETLLALALQLEEARPWTRKWVQP